MWDEYHRSAWRVWVPMSLLVHAALLVFFLIFGSFLFPMPTVREVVIPITLTGGGEDASTEYELSREILHFRKKTHPRVREVLAVSSDVLALAPPPEEVPLTKEASGGGFSFQLEDSGTLDGFVFGGTHGGRAATGAGGGNSKGTEGTFEEYVGGLRQIGFQVFYRDVSPLNAIGRWEMVASQVSVTIGGVTINPGDVVIAEFDGVVVVPADVAEQGLEAAEKIDGAEAKVRVEMQAGESPLSSLERHGHI